MKRILVLALAVILCLSLVACGEKKNEENANVVEAPKVNEIPEVIVVPEVEEEPTVVISGEDLSGEEAAGEEVVEEPVTAELSGEIAE